MDVELGTNDYKTKTFYPPKNYLSRIVNYNWKIMSDFIWQHIIDF